MDPLTIEDYCWDKGTSFRQKNLIPTATYDEKYLQTYVDIDNQVRRLSRKRMQVLESFVSRGSLLDFGAGTFRFVDAAIDCGWSAFGYEVIATDHSRLCPQPFDPPGWDIVTFFDSLEHLPAPHETIERLRPKKMMISVPECHYPGGDWFMAWKHRRPGEHLWHWHRESLDEFMVPLGYRPLMHSYFEDEFRQPYSKYLRNILTVIYEKR